MKHIIIAPEGGAPDALQAFVVPDTRAAIEMAVEALIQRLDDGDGDPDVEPNGDELDGNGSEDDFMSHGANGPGCPVSDSAEYAATEWTTRGSHKDREPGVRPEVFAYHEDAEDDDPDHGLDEGEPNFAEPPKGHGAGCIISDPDYGVDDEPHDAQTEGV